MGNQSGSQKCWRGLEKLRLELDFTVFLSGDGSIFSNGSAEIIAGINPVPSSVAPVGAPVNLGEGNSLSCLFQLRMGWFSYHIDI